MDQSKFTVSFERTRDQVEKRLTSIFTEYETAPQNLIDAMRYASLDGGKRFRPFLVMETTALFSADPHLALDTAIAIESIHCYSLIHDDLPVMDNDELRRGRATLWKWSDEATAILAGDALQALAFEQLCKTPIPSNALIKIELINGLAKASGCTGMVGGQVRDLDAENKNDEVSFADVIQMQAQKTGALIGFAAEAGAIIGGAPQNERTALRLFGEKLGLAFQVRDDLLDIEGTSSELGKTPGKDQQVGKATLVTTLGREKAETFLSDLQRGALYALETFGDKADVLREAVAFVCERRN